MPEKLQNDVSDFSEIPDVWWQDNVPPFFSAFGFGTAAGTTALIFAAGLASLPNFVPEILFGGLLYFGIFVGIFTLAAMLVVGLPVTFLFKAMKLERRPLYAFAGTSLGFLIFFALFGALLFTHVELAILAGVGALTGFVTSWRWGGWREARARILRATDAL